MTKIVYLGHPFETKYKPDEKEAISDMTEEAVKEVLDEIFPETPEDRWREFLK